MTIILTTASSQGCVSSSDGRIIAENTIKCERYDKTFTLYGDKIIGAYAGMMSFGKYTCHGTTHVNKFIYELSGKKSPISLYEFVTFLKNELLTIIQSLSEKEWTIRSRNLVIFLVGRSDLRDGDYTIYEINFGPDDENTGVEAQILGPQGPVTSEMMMRANSDSTSAQAAALNYLDKYKSNPDVSVDEMTDIHQEALTEAITAAKRNKTGAHASCGGFRFYQRST